MCWLFFFTAALAAAQEECKWVSIKSDNELERDDIVHHGVVQDAWKGGDKAKNVTTDTFYLYVEVDSVLSTHFKVSEYHASDENPSHEAHKWTTLTVEEDAARAKLLHKFVVYEVKQPCHQSQGSATVKSNIKFEDDGCAFTISWNRVCGDPTATKFGLLVGFSELSSEVVKDGITTQDFDADFKNSKFVIYPEETSTTFYIHTSEAKAFMSTPYVVIDQDILSVTLNGTGVTSDWIDQVPKAVQVNYECLEENGVEAEIELVLELPYFSDIHIHYLKQCGYAVEAGSGISFGSVFVILLLVGIFASVGWCVFMHQVKGLRGWDVLPFGDKLKRFYEARFGQQGHHQWPGPEEQELPDIEDSTKSLRPSRYGAL